VIHSITHVAKPLTFALFTDWSRLYWLAPVAGIAAGAGAVRVCRTIEERPRIRADAGLKDFQLVTRGRLSVVPVTPAQYARVLALSRRREAPSPALARKPSTARRSPTRRKRAR
jgi:hypothetical protein